MVGLPQRLTVHLYVCSSRRLTGWSKPQEVTEAICEALKRNFVFKGISDGLLVEVSMPPSVCVRKRMPGPRCAASAVDVYLIA